jgi:dTDP-4-amino-4,6-dideoxygalactose transaminase
MLRNYGSIEKYYHEEIGFNSRLDNIQAIALNIKLPLLDTWNDQRIAAAELYSERLCDLNEIQLPAKAEGKEHVYHLYVIETKERTELQKYLTANGIGTLIHYPKPPHLQKAYVSDFGKKYHLPIAEKLAEQVLSLPMFPGITENEVDYVCDSIHKFYKR